MSLLTSKVQHKAFEKGEFTDEKERDLAETLQLIETFPWDAERTLTVIQLTGPSVTIVDEDVNYLKVGLFFNGKYCLYYLDNDNHLYEYHTADMADVKKQVTDFFNHTLDLAPFEKHLINIGNRAHFETAYFEYREKLWRVVMLTAFLLFYSIFFLVIDITMLAKNVPIGLDAVFIPMSLFIFYVIFRIFYNAYTSRTNYMQISRGNPVFSFGYTADTVKQYNKADIQRIIAYESRGQRNPNMVEVFEIEFKTGETIRFTNMLIGSIDFHSKFQDGLDNMTIPFMIGKKGLFKML